MSDEAAARLPKTVHLIPKDNAIKRLCFDDATKSLRPNLGGWLLAARVLPRPMQGFVKASDFTMLRMPRFFSFVRAIAALVILMPLMSAIALAIKVTSRGPILFSQLRVGRDNQPFRMLNINAHTKALAKRDKTPQEQYESCEAKKHSKPGE